MHLLKKAFVLILMVAVAKIRAAPTDSSIAVTSITSVSDKNASMLATNTSEVARLEQRQVFRHCEIIGRNSVHLIIYPFNDGIHNFGLVDWNPKCLPGLKDELKKRCCEHINNWECRIDPGRPAMGYQIAFTFGIFCKRPDHCIEDAYFAVNHEDPREDFICQ
ncbi:hypothetical protein PpBr36_01947 [Pyricularia pennisetigena]|uniref:hypothetical protein n=1 Tax=Pyricularia pennisetigena TaxID=1578925 RepID=UPI00115273A2|nr:hypothetical protein PpBr36_01947 [Pyricularia pennisetigena]TLS28294.1 hypothetical protein PpBr36_01947 [Pyricularia pennisetigena]